MSYIRPHSPYKYIEGNSNGDYVFESSYRKGKKLFPYIKDYGSIKTETILDILMRFEEKDNNLIRKHLLLRLCNNLKIKLRKKPLTDKQWLKEYIQTSKKFEKGFENKKK